MIIYAAIGAVILVLIAGVSGIGFWGTLPWYLGALAGLAQALVWYASKAARAFMGLIGIGLLVAVTLGAGDDLSGETRAFFNGCSLAIPVGFALIAYLRWSSFKPKLITVARVEKVKWLLRLLGESH
jgi:hypothetical protein